MTSADIELAIIQRWPPRQTLTVPNVTSGLFDWGESDLIQVSDAGYVTEIEIKISIADLKREWQKRRWQEHWVREWLNRIRYYWIAMPLELCEPAREHIPEWVGAGILGVSMKALHESWAFYRYQVKKVLRPASNRTARPLTLRERSQIGRLGTLRYWGLRETIDELQRQKGTT